MPLVLANRVQETSTTTGTGTLTLDGAVLGYQTFAAGIGSGNTCYYAITSGTGAWEVGIGTVGTGTLARTTLLSSSTGSLISFTGTLNVYVTYPSEKSVNLDAANVITGYPITVTDNVFTLQDNIDPNKQAQFQLVNIPTGTTTTYTLPAGVANAATLIDAQTVQTISGAKTFSGGVTFSAASGSYGTNPNASTYNYASGATTTGNTKTVNVGTGGLSGSTTNITVGATAGASTTTMNGQVDLGGTTTSVNFARVVGAATGAAPTISAQGSDANISLKLTPKGTGVVTVSSDAVINGLTVGLGGGSVAQNTAFGGVTLPFNTTGNFNIAIGYQSMFYNKIGSSNVGLGFATLFLNTTANQNLAMGVSALTVLTTSVATLGAITGGSGYTNGTYTAVAMTPVSGATFVTYPTVTVVVAGGVVSSVTLVTAGQGASSVSATVLTVAAALIGGTGSGFSIAVGSFVAGGNNTAIGYQAGSTLATGSNNTLIGYQAAASTTTVSNEVTLGNGSVTAFRIPGLSITAAASSLTIGTQFAVTKTDSAVNYLNLTGAGTNAAPTLSAQGSDANINLKLTPKGTGVVQITGTAYSPNFNLTDAATIAWDTATAGGQVATFTFVSSNRTMGAPTNLVNGAFYALAVIQNAGSNTLTWNSVFKWAAGTAPTLSTAAGAKDYFTFRSDGTNLYQQGISQAVA